MENTNAHDITSSIGGCACQPSMAANFSYDSAPPVDPTQELSLTQSIAPTNGLTTGPYEFNIESNEDSFLQLSSLLMTASFKIVKKDGSALHPAASIAPANNTLASLWSQIRVKINDVEVNPNSAQEMPYKAYISTLLSYSPDSAAQLRAAGFVHELNGRNMHRAAAAGQQQPGNASFEARREACEESKEVHLAGPVPVDLLAADNHLAPRTKLTLTFYPSSLPFFLHTKQFAQLGELRVVFTKLRLHFNRLYLAEAYTRAVLQQSKSLPQRYLAPYTECQLLEVPSNLSRWTLPVYPAGHMLPKALVVGFKSTSARAAYAKNPFCFESFGLNRFGLLIDGVLPPNSLLEPHFASDGTARVAREYQRLFDETGKTKSLIARQGFLAGHTLFPFDLSPDKCNGVHLHPGREARLDLDLGWSAPLAEGVTVVVLAIFDQVLTVSPHSRFPSAMLV